MDQLDPEPVWCHPLIVPSVWSPFQWECQSCIPDPCANRMWDTPPAGASSLPSGSSEGWVYSAFPSSLGISFLMAPCPSVSALVGFPGISLQFSRSSTSFPWSCYCPCSAPRMSPPQFPSSVAEEGFYSFVPRKWVSRDEGGWVAKEKRWKKHPKVVGKAPHPTSGIP